MNNRDYKLFHPDGFFHIFNRGVGKIKIFLCDADYRFFLFKLREALFPYILAKRQQNLPSRYHRKVLPEHAFTLLAYCLMPNHFHFVVRQNTSLPVTVLIQSVCTCYVKYFNKKYGREGGLLEHKFRAVKVESDPQLQWLSAYVHQNPKVGALVETLGDWEYSSYPDYMGLRQGTLCDTGFILNQFHDRQAYSKFVDDSYQLTKQRKELEYLLMD